MTIFVLFYLAGNTLINPMSSYSTLGDCNKAKVTFENQNKQVKNLQTFCLESQIVK